MNLLAQLEAKEKGSINVPNFISNDLFAVLKTNFKEYNFRNLIDVYKGHLYNFCDFVANPEKFKVRDLTSGDKAWHQSEVVILGAYLENNDSAIIVIEPLL